MVLAYILITTKGRNELKVAEELLKCNEVDNLHIVYGEYDIIIKVKAKNLIKLREFTMYKLSKIEEIDKTTTLIATDQTKEGDNVFKRKF